MKTIISELRKEFTVLETFELKPNFTYLGNKYNLDPRTVKNIIKDIMVNQQLELNHPVWTNTQK